MLDSLEVGKTSSFGELNALKLHLRNELHRSGGGLQIHLDLLVHQNIDTHLPPSEEPAKAEPVSLGSAAAVVGRSSRSTHSHSMHCFLS